MALQKIKKTIIELAKQCYGNDVIVDVEEGGGTQACDLYLNSDSALPLLSFVDPNAFELITLMLKRKKTLLNDVEGLSQFSVVEFEKDL